MPDDTPVRYPIRKSIQNVLSRIRETAAKRGKKTELPTAAFSNALNAIGENFVDLPLTTERRGLWWLDEAGFFHDCIVRRAGDRTPRNFARGISPEWDWYPTTASRLADPMTGPDHVVSIKVPSLKIEGLACLEQKLRFGTPADAFAGASTYLKHLCHGLGYPSSDNGSLDVDNYFNGMCEAAKSILCRAKKDGALAYSGSVPQVCLVSIALPPHNVTVIDKSGATKVECPYVGFLAPTINKAEFAGRLPTTQVVNRAKVRLWIGLDSLLEACTDQDVEAAWSKSVAHITDSICNPTWRKVEAE